jgi:hypothetical protein
VRFCSWFGLFFFFCWFSMYTYVHHFRNFNYPELCSVSLHLKLCCNMFVAIEVFRSYRQYQNQGSSGRFSKNDSLRKRDRRFKAGKFGQNWASPNSANSLMRAPMR